MPAKNICGRRSIVIANALSLFLLTLFVVGVLVSQSVQAQTYTVMHTFLGVPDGANPNPMIRDAEGNLYGTTYAGGSGSPCGGHIGAAGPYSRLTPQGTIQPFLIFLAALPGRVQLLL